MLRRRMGKLVSWPDEPRLYRTLHRLFDQHRWRSLEEIPATTPLAETVSKDLKRRGFRFVGPTIVYAMMQAVGLVNDHVVGCYRRAEVARLRPQLSA